MAATYLKLRSVRKAGVEAQFAELGKQDVVVTRLRGVTKYEQFSAQ